MKRTGFHPFIVKFQPRARKVGNRPPVRRLQFSAPKSNQDQLNEMLHLVEEHREARQFKEAERLGQEALQFVEVVMVPIDGEVVLITPLLSLVQVYQDQRKLKKAFEFSRRALTIVEHVDDSRSPSALLVKMMHASFLFDTADIDAGISLIREVHDAVKSGLDLPQKDQAFLYHLLGRSRTEERIPAEAREFYEKALTIHEQMGENEAMAGIKVEIGATFRAEKNYQEAVEHLLEAKIMMENTSTWESATSIKCRFLLGACFYMLRRREEAVFYWQSYQDLRRQCESNPQDEVWCAVCISLSELYLEKKKYPDALRNASQALALAERLFAMESKDVFTAVMVKANTLARMGNASEAKALYRRADRIQKKLGTILFNPP